MKIMTELINIIGIIVTLIGIAVSMAGIQQPVEQPTCTVGNIVAGEGATVNINCIVAP